jgi:hypothetical protein
MRRPFLFGIVGLVLGVAATAAVTRYRPSPASPLLTTEYQLVLLSNGQAYFGKLDNLGDHYLVLHDVFYIQSQTNPDTKQIKNSLVKRGKEWHEPDRMILDAQHVVLIEPVSPSSTVAKLIREYAPAPGTAP